jgi:molybdopterin synthase sulfur carrier subunit
VKLHILYFARLRERFGVGSESLDVPADINDLAGLIAWLSRRGPVWSEELTPSRPYRLAVNQEMAEPATPLKDGDEVAIFPPVTGG